MLDKRGGDSGSIGRPTGDYVEAPRRKAGDGEDVTDGGMATRRELGGLENDGVAGRKGVGNGADAENVGCIPDGRGELLESLGTVKSEGSLVCYHGAMPRTTPYGSLRTIALVPSSSHTGIEPPRAVMILPAISLNNFAASGILKPELKEDCAPVSVSM